MYSLPSSQPCAVVLWRAAELQHEARSGWDGRLAPIIRQRGNGRGFHGCLALEGSSIAYSSSALRLPVQGRGWTGRMILRVAVAIEVCHAPEQAGPCIFQHVNQWLSLVVKTPRNRLCRAGVVPHRWSHVASVDCTVGIFPTPCLYVVTSLAKEWV